MGKYSAGHSKSKFDSWTTKLHSCTIFHKSLCYLISLICLQYFVQGFNNVTKVEGNGQTYRSQLKVSKSFYNNQFFIIMEKFRKNDSIYLSQKVIINSSIFCYLFSYLQEGFYGVCDNIYTFYLFLLQKDFDTFHKHIEHFCFFFLQKNVIPFANLFLKFFFVLIISSRHIFMYEKNV